MSVWNLLYKELTGTHDYIKPNTPATQNRLLRLKNHWAVNCLMT